MRGATDSREMILNGNVTAPHQSASQTASPQGEVLKDARGTAPPKKGKPGIRKKIAKNRRMENGNIYNEKLNIFARRTLASGVKPIETMLTPVFEADFGDVAAYRMQLKINSVVAGVLGENDYLSAQIPEDIAVKYALRSVRKAVAAFAELTKNNLPCSMLFVRCPVALIYAENAGGLLSSELSGAATENDVDARAFAGKICLEFDASATDADGETLNEFFAEARALSLKIAVDGLGGEGFALEKLLCACPDFAFTSARLNAIATDAEKKNALAPVVNLLANLGGRVVAAEIENDEELREYRARDIFGFVPGAGYAGRLNVRLETIALERLIEKSAAEEGVAVDETAPHQSASQTASPQGEALKTRQELSLPLGGKVPSESEANEGRDVLSQEEGKDGEPREDLTSSVNSVDSFPEGEAEGFGGKATEGETEGFGEKATEEEAENKAEQSEVNGND